MFVSMVNLTTTILYATFFDPFEHYVQVDWFRPILVCIALPSHLIITACRYTRFSFFRGRRHRRLTHNHRIRVMVAQHPSHFHRGIQQPSVAFAPSSIESPPYLPTSNDIHTFLQDIDVLQHLNVLLAYSVLTLPDRYTALTHRDPQYHQILLQAKSLQTTMRHYRQTLPLANPTIYISSTERELPIVIDTGASCSVTPNPSDFVTQPKVADVKKMEGLNGHFTEVLGIGPIQWDIEDAQGIRDTIDTSAYLVPSANIRLFSPQVYIAEQTKKQNVHCQLCLNTKGASLTLANGTIFQFPIQQENNLPFMLTHKALHPSKKTHLGPHERKLRRFENLASFLCSSAFTLFAQGNVFNNINSTEPVVPAKLDDSTAVLSRANWNLSDPQQELLLWHQRLGHINFEHVQFLLAKPKDKQMTRIIQPQNNKSSHCTHCLCEACQYAKQKRKKPPSAKTTARTETEGVLSRDVLIPGQRVSVDLYQSSTKGRLPHTFGKEKTSQQYTGGALFVDHATRLVYHTHQFTTTAAETINSKHQFERFSSNFGVAIREYVGDNNPFHSQDWKVDCLNQQQTCIYSGVGAHHQNYAERYVQTIFNMGRALLLHFAIHWPQAATPELWPFAIDHAVYLWNRLPKQPTRISPLEHFTSTMFGNHHHLQRLHVFGCPVYVLDPKLQDGKKLPKWKRRSRRGIYLGVSRQHSSTVHLVLNPDTGKISPQYHVVFDDTFSTVFSDGEFTQTVWDSLLVSNIERHPDADEAVDIIPFETHNESENEASPTMQSQDTITIKIGSPNETNPFQRPIEADSDLSPASTKPPTIPEGVSDTTTTHVPSNAGAPSAPEGGPSLAPEGANSTSTNTPISLRRSPRNLTPVQPRRSQRSHKEPIRFSPSHHFTTSLPRRTSPTSSRQVHFNRTARLPKVPGEQLNQQYLSSLTWDKLLGLCSNARGTLGSFAIELQQNSSYNKLIDYLNPAAFITLANKEDNPTFQEAMASPDAAGFIKAMEIEIATLSDLNVYELVPRPKDKRVISSVWAFKRKRYPDGSVRKLKARFCARGFEQQQGVDYFETFAPVVMWITVRLLLIMSILMDLETKQIDYTAAFVHAPIDCLVYVETPKGFEVKGMVWKLNKSLYGLAQSPRNFFLHTKNQLTNRLGFTQSIADPCLFISRDVICLIYVDDALLFYKDQTAVANLTAKMKAENIQFREEEDVAGFLGVHIDRKDDGTIHLTQQGLIQRIVTALHLDSSAIKPVSTPATGYLPIDEFGDPPHETFSYSSVVGQLNYLAGHSRPDITMATSQVARYLHEPKHSHELALIRIGRYLKGTADKGLILRPRTSETLELDVYVDAAFACGWGTEIGTNPDAVKSRTGYVIEIANCPILWVSKLQSTVATSTMESEYTALSMALRAYIPLAAIVRSVLGGLDYLGQQQATFKATVHEDNQGALILANLEPGRHTVRSKFYALRLHWFRTWTQGNDIAIQFVDTLQQKADFLTKAMQPGPFQRNRQLTMGW